MDIILPGIKGFLCSHSISLFTKIALIENKMHAILCFGLHSLTWIQDKIMHFSKATQSGPCSF